MNPPLLEIEIHILAKDLPRLDSIRIHNILGLNMDDIAGQSHNAAKITKLITATKTLGRILPADDGAEVAIGS